MRRFKRILLIRGDGLVGTPVDPEFLQFLEMNRPDVTLAGWFAVPAPSLLASLLGTRSQPGEEFVRVGLQRALEEEAAGLRARGLAVDTVTLEGDPAEATLRLVESGHFDLVVKPAEGVGTDAPVTFGALDRTLVRQSPVPVLLVKPQPDRLPRVMVTIDVGSSQHAKLNQTLMELAVSQAELTGAELHVAHAWQLVGEAALRGGAFTEISGAEIDAHKEQERALRHGELQALFERHGKSTVPMVEHIVEGPAGLAVAAVARTVQPHLLVMGVTPRRRFASLVLNDFAETVLGLVDCSVLIVNGVTVEGGAP